MKTGMMYIESEKRGNYENHGRTVCRVTCTTFR